MYTKISNHTFSGMLTQHAKQHSAYRYLCPVLNASDNILEPVVDSLSQIPLFHLLVVGGELSVGVRGSPQPAQLHPGLPLIHTA